MADVDEFHDFLEAAYRAVFRRAPDQAGLDGYAGAMSQGMTPASVLRTFLGSEEFRLGSPSRVDDYDAKSDPKLARFLSPESDALVSELTALRHLDAGLYEQLHREACRREHSSVEYPEDHLHFHKRRFAELLNACVCLLKGLPHPRLLDIGNTQNTSWFKAVVAEAELITADRPGGPLYEASDRHVVVDLEQGDVSSISDLGPYDLIILTEVIEHLSVNPIVLLERLLRLLTANGSLYLTTPNFFRAQNLALISRRENPLSIYPVDNSNRHYHVREYAMGELLEFVTQAGGRLKAWYFSDCWDEVPVSTGERANLVVIAGRQE